MKESKVENRFLQTFIRLAIFCYLLCLGQILHSELHPFPVVRLTVVVRLNDNASTVSKKHSSIIGCNKNNV